MYIEIIHASVHSEFQFYFLNCIQEYKLPSLITLATLWWFWITDLRKMDEIQMLIGPVRISGGFGAKQTRHFVQLIQPPVFILALLMTAGRNKTSRFI